MHLIEEMFSFDLIHYGEDYETGNVSDEYDTADDELDRYLCKRLDTTTLSDNPLEFWKKH